MFDRNDSANESGLSSRWALATVAIGALLTMGAAVALVPPAAEPVISNRSAATYAAPDGYLPEQYINQATEIEPQPETF